MAALLAHKARHVTTVEILPQVKTQAEQTLAANGVTNVNVVLGDGAQGWSVGAPYDVIVMSGALRMAVTSTASTWRNSPRCMPRSIRLVMSALPRVTTSSL